MRREVGLGQPELDELMATIDQGLSEYTYDQYRNYPARRQHDGRPPWESYLLCRLRQMAADPDWTFFGRAGPGAPLLLAARTARWDREHFGVPLSAVTPVFCPDGHNLKAGMSELIRECLADLRHAGVEFVSARINGDQLDVLHAFEDAGFRYYETAIWPVTSTEHVTQEKDPRVRLLADSEVERAMEIAARHAYPRSHFYCDPGFARERVDQMYAKWVRSAWEAGDPVAVIESDGKVAGAFVFRMDDMLSAELGYTYGRMRFLALDGASRGRGLGRALFYGCMRLMKEMGADYIDSGYPTKNHLSAKLHVQTSFYSVYEEATFHLRL